MSEASAITYKSKDIMDQKPLLMQNFPLCGGLSKHHYKHIDYYKLRVFIKVNASDEALNRVRVTV